MLLFFFIKHTTRSAIAQGIALEAAIPKPIRQADSESHSVSLGCEILKTSIAD
jgi:hypothetical protein